MGPLRDRKFRRGTSPKSDDNLNYNSWPVCDNPPPNNMPRLNQPAARPWPMAGIVPEIELEKTGRPHRTTPYNSMTARDDNPPANSKTRKATNVIPPAPRPWPSDCIRQKQECLPYWTDLKPAYCQTGRHITYNGLDISKTQRIIL